MIRQYAAQRRRDGHNLPGVGVIPVGTIFYVQDECWWRDRYRGQPICRRPRAAQAASPRAQKQDTDTGRSARAAAKSTR